MSSHAIISALSSDLYYLIDKSYKFPIGVGVIINDPLDYGASNK